MRKDLQHIRLEQSAASAEIQRPATNDQRPNFTTAENIEVKSHYAQSDIEGLDHLDFGAGFTPNLRGP